MVLTVRIFHLRLLTGLYPKKLSTPGQHYHVNIKHPILNLPKNVTYMLKTLIELSIYTTYWKAILIIFLTMCHLLAPDNHFQKLVKQSPLLLLQG